MADHLSALDATFIELEDADPASHMHVGAIIEFEGPAPGLGEMRELLERRMGALPRFHQRLSPGKPGRLAWPRWVDDPDYDLAQHTRHAALPGPGERAQLEAWAGEFWSHRLDRDRPLWEMALVTGLERGRWALATKTHHCLVDGRSTADLGPVLLDVTPEPAEGPIVTPPPPLGEGALASLEHLVEGAVGAAVHPREALRRARALAEVLVRDELIGAAGSSLNGAIGAHRRYAVVDCRLAELKAIKRVLGGTVNDAVLAVCTAGLRELLLARGEEPPARGLRAMVPVDVRADAEHLALGNRVSSLFVELPVAIDDPLERYARVRANALARKREHQAEGSRALVEVAGLAPPILHSQLARSLFGRRLFNLTITNIPGPQLPLYMLGRRMLAAYPLVPIFTDHSVGIAISSYDGRVAFGINADARVRDLDVLSEALDREIEHLLDAAGAPAGA
jgi:diacylglycerol O-acyltransferase / wax synthase